MLCVPEANAQLKVTQRPFLTDMNPAADLLPIVDISAGVSGSKKITPDNFMIQWGMTVVGKAIATAASASDQRTALGLSSVANTGNYSDLTGKPALGTASSLDHGTSSGNLVRLDVSTGKLPAVDGSLLTNLPGGVLASQVEAEAGAENTKTMTPLRTAQAIAALVSTSGFEPAMGNPGTNGYVLSSTTTGVRSWIAAASGTGDMLKSENLSGLANYNTARINLGLAIGTNVQAYDTNLTTWAGKTAPSGTVLGNSDTQTLTNKTLTSPVINLTSDATGDVYYRNVSGLLTRLPIGSTGQVLTVASGLPSWATAGGGGSLTNFTEAVNTTTPNISTPVVSLTATNAAGDVDIALVSKGSGSIARSVANNSATGGNKRGPYAVDLQAVRSFSSNVASASYSIILNGQANTSNGNYSLSMGSSNTASGSYSTVINGDTNEATGSYTFAQGVNNLANADYSWVSGARATAKSINGSMARANGYFSLQGDAQTSKIVFRRATTDATATELTSNGGTPAAGTRLTLTNYSAYTFSGMVIGKTAASDAKGWKFSGVIERGANAAATALIGTITQTSEGDAGASAWTFTASADTTNGSLKLEVVGAAATNIRWVATVDTVEVSY